MDDSTALDIRAGLPDALRILLDAFPRADWDAHPHFSGLVAFWLDRHAMFRKLTRSMAMDAEAAADNAISMDEYHNRLSRLGGFFAQQLHGHHQIEDHHYFPVLSQMERPLEAGFSLLDRDHHALDGVLSGFVDDANAVLGGTLEPVRFRDGLLRVKGLLNRHLEDEEDLIVPVILKHGPGALR